VGNVQILSIKMRGENKISVSTVDAARLMGKIGRDRE